MIIKNQNLKHISQIFSCIENKREDFYTLKLVNKKTFIKLLEMLIKNGFLREVEKHPYYEPSNYELTARGIEFYEEIHNLSSVFFSLSGFFKLKVEMSINFKESKNE